MNGASIEQEAVVVAARRRWLSPFTPATSLEGMRQGLLIGLALVLDGLERSDSGFRWAVVCHRCADAADPYHRETSYRVNRADCERCPADADLLARLPLAEEKAAAAH